MKKNLALVAFTLLFALGCFQGKKLVTTEKHRKPVETADTYGVEATPANTPIVRQTADEVKVKDVGEIGDIKYSVLSLVDFQQQNDKGWVLMQGQTLDETWDLTSLYGAKFSNMDGKGADVKALPDARGVFLRGLNVNLKQEDAAKNGNPDMAIVMGKHQDDEVKPHQHKYKLNGSTRYYNGKDDQPGDYASSTNVNGDTEKNDGLETRPRNISVYIYIKVKHIIPEGK